MRFNTLQFSASRFRFAYWLKVPLGSARAGEAKSASIVKERRQYRTLTKRIVDYLVINCKGGVFRNSEIPGFGIRVYPSGRKVYGRNPHPSRPVWTSGSDHRACVKDKRGVLTAVSNGAKTT